MVSHSENAKLVDTMILFLSLRSAMTLVLCYGMKTETFFDTNFSVVKDEPSGDTSEVVEHPLFGLS